MDTGCASGSAGRWSSQSASCHSYADSKTTDAFFGGTSVRKANGSALSRSLPCDVRSSNLYFVPDGRSGMKSSQMPEAPSERIGCSRPSQPLKSPTTLTERGVRRPDGERDAGDAVHHAGVRAEPRVQLLVPPLAGEVDVELAERRQERVRVAEDVRVAGRVARPRARSRAAARALDHPLEDPSSSCRSSSTPIGRTRTDSASGGRRGRRHRPPPVGAEVRVRVRELVRLAHGRTAEPRRFAAAPDMCGRRSQRSRGCAGVGEGATGKPAVSPAKRGGPSVGHVVTGSSSRMRRIPATGIGSQSGRMLSS